eukprot:1152698-Pelagomonas_calceolata.AAC.16
MSRSQRKGVPSSTTCATKHCLTKWRSTKNKERCAIEDHAHHQAVPDRLEIFKSQGDACHQASPYRNRLEAQSGGHWLMRGTSG